MLIYFFRLCNPVPLRYNMPMEEKKYISTIGLEIHVELKTKTKMFCNSPHDPDEKHPNMNVCPVCMGHPGTLPTINKEAVRQVLRVGTALGGALADNTRFDRKNYFYPDLPKGYQISQQESPLVRGGKLELLSSGKEIRIHHIHLEEDAGKLIHDKKTKSTLVDFNRAGVPLMELVTEPDMNSAEEAEEFARELQLLCRYLGASDADMEKGQMRVEVNISLRALADKHEFDADHRGKIQRDSASGRRESATLGTKVEVKNINSFRAASRAIAYEIERQSKKLAKGESLIQETRGWDEEKQRTTSQRSKEEAHDYRYFPEPDLPPLLLSAIPEFSRGAITASLPELPQKKRRRFQDEYKLSDDQAIIFTYHKELADYFEEAVSELLEWVADTGKEPDTVGRYRLIQLAANYLLSDLLGLLKAKEASMADLQIMPENFAELMKMIYRKEISSRAAKDVLARMFAEGGDPSEIVAAEGLMQVSDASALQEIVKKVIVENPNPAADYKKGKGNALQFLVGQVMRATRGSADPNVVRELLLQLLS